MRRSPHTPHTHRPHRVALSLAALLPLAACAAPTHQVTLRVADDQGNPLPNATLLAVPLNETDVPLPVTSKTLGYYIALQNARKLAVTDDRGIASLTLHADVPHAIDVTPPPLDDPPFSDAGSLLVWRWTLTPDADAVWPPADHPNPPGIELTLAP